MRKKLFSIMLTCVMCLCTAVPAFAADQACSGAESAPSEIADSVVQDQAESANGQVRAMAAGNSYVTALFAFNYVQTDARSMLPMINSFRTGSEAWAYDQSGNVVNYPGLSELSYDYELENIAMVRAGELAVMYMATGTLTHERPDGQHMDELTTPDGYYAAGENILMGYGISASKAMQLWKEENEKYDGQGHRRNMLDSSYQGVGIGHVNVEGYDFWVQEFGSPVKSTEETDASDGWYYDPIPFKASDASNISDYDSTRSVEINVGESFDILKLRAKADLMDTFQGVPVFVDADSWNISDPSIASIDEGMITGNSRGLTYMTGTATIGGTTVTETLPVYCGLFTDAADSSSWFYNAVYWAVDNGITNGIGDGLFGPDGVCTRAQAVTFMWNEEGKPDASGSTNFRDVADGAWYADAVKWAVQNGITSGTGDGTTFSPDQNCTRAQIATLLWNRAGSPEPSSQTSRFSDVGQNEWYTKAVLWAYENGITSGTGNGTTFSPNQECTRSQIVTMLYNAQHVG